MAKNGYTRYPGCQQRGGVLTKSTHAMSLANAHPDLPLAASHTGPPVSGYSTPRSHPTCSPPPENDRATQPQTDRQPTRNECTKPRLRTVLNPRARIGRFPNVSPKKMTWFSRRVQPRSALFFRKKRGAHFCPCLTLPPEEQTQKI